MPENLPPTHYQSDINADQHNSFPLLDQPEILIEVGTSLTRTWYIKNLRTHKNTALRLKSICHCPTWILDDKCYILDVPKSVAEVFGKTESSSPFTVHCIADASLKEMDKLSLPAFKEMLLSERSRPICTAKDYYCGP